MGRLTGVRVLVVAASTPPNVGGYETQVMRIASGLVDAGHEVDLLSFAPGSSSIEAGKIRIFEGRARHLLGGSFPVPAPGEIRRRMGAADYDLVMTHTRFFLPTYFAAREAHRRGIPILHVEHGSSPLRGHSAPVNVISEAFDRTAGRFVCTHAAAVVGVSAAAANFTRSLGANDPTVITNSAPFAAPDVVEARLEAVARRDVSVPAHIVFIGRLVPNKGVHLLIEACRRLSTQARPRLTIVGDGPERARLEFQAAGDANIRFTGALTGAALQETLSAADLFVSPSYSEGFGLAVLEACAAGVPVIASDCEGHRELLRGGEIALLHRVGDIGSLASALDRGISDPVASAARARAAYAELQPLSAESVSQAWDNLVRSVGRVQS